MEPYLLFGVLAAAAFAAGIINAVAGGGTLLTFPALMAVLAATYGDHTAAVANATSTVALLPGSLAGAWAYRREFAEARPFAMRLLLPSVIGGLIGALLVVAFPKVFGTMVPWLILTAAVLFAVQQPISKLLRRRREAAARTGTGGASGVHQRQVLLIVGFQFLVAVYGGYFGAGIGILMLTALGLMGLNNIHQANAVKALLASVINMATMAVFVVQGMTGWPVTDGVREWIEKTTGRAVTEAFPGGLIDWPVAGVMAVSAILGGYAGATVARRLQPVYVRAVVIVIGFTLAGYYLWKQFAAARPLG